MKRLFIKIGLVKDGFLDMLFPDACLNCGKRGLSICENCKKKLLVAERGAIPDVKICFDYRDEIVRKIIWALKYKRRSSIGNQIGEIIYGKLADDMPDLRLRSQESPILLVPIPLSKERLKTRGYNQSEKIAQGIIKACPENIFTIDTTSIEKYKNTLPQARISNRQKRLKNVSGAFRLRDKNAFTNKIVIIIDDVTTTGATMNEVMHLVSSAGARYVSGIAFAH